MSRSIAFGLPEAKSPLTALVTVEIMPLSLFLVPDLVPPPEDLDLAEDAVFLEEVDWVPVDLAVPLDCFAPPDAVRLPAAPLLVAVEVFEPPDFEAFADLEVVAFEADFLLVPAELDAPVLLVPELREVELFFELPVFAAADLFPPWLDLEDDLVDELFAVAIGCFSDLVCFGSDNSDDFDRFEI